MMTEEESILLNCIVCCSIATDPVLLPCLHNGCKICINNVAGSTDEKPVLEQCPSCHESFEVSGSTSPPFRDNFFVSARVAALKCIDEDDNCHICRQRAGLDAAAHHGCMQCQSLLCDTCLGNHQVFLKNHTVVDLDTYYACKHKLELAPPRLCQSHGRELAFACSTCTGLKCSGCASGCVHKGHDLRPIEENSRTVTVKVREALRQLAERADPIQQYKEMLLQVESLRKEHAAEVNQNKRYILDLVAKHYDKVESFLDKYYNSLAIKLSDVVEAAEQLKVKVDYSTTYCGSIINAADAVSIVDQQNLLLSRLEFLLAEAASLVGAVEIDEVVAIDVERPATFEDIVTKCIGHPKRIPGKRGTMKAAGDAPDALPSGAALRIQGGIDVPPPGSPQDIHTSQIKYGARASLSSTQCMTKAAGCALDAFPGGATLQSQDGIDVPSPGPSQGPQTSPSTESPLSFATKNILYDLAITRNDSVLVATQENGVKEYEIGNSLREIRCWKPSPQEWVYSVDVLQDGRSAVAGVYYAYVLLTYSSAKQSCPWVEILRFDTATLPTLMAVSADDRHLAIASRGRSVFYVHETSSGRVLLQQDLDYEISCLAISSTQQVIICSKNKRPHDNQHSVEAFSVQRGNLLWRHVYAEQVVDICLDTQCQLFMAVQSGVRVVRIEADRGWLSEEEIIKGNDLTVAARLSVGQRAGCLAVLSGDQRTVTVYRMSS